MPTSVSVIADPSPPSLSSACRATYTVQPTVPRGGWRGSSEEPVLTCLTISSGARKV